VSIEDRVRAATRARADLVTRHRPLELPAEASARARRSQPARRWLGWGAPFAAAVLVIVLAVVLVAVRQAGGSPPGSGTGTPWSSDSGTPASAMAPVPRYYVALTSTGNSSGQVKAVVGDDHTGRTVAVLNPTPAQQFYGVTGASDDRTFVMTSYTATTQQFYLLRISPGSAHPAQLTKLPIKPITTRSLVSGLALSPDGKKLAVMWRNVTTATSTVTYLSVYSVSSGAVLDSYLTHAENDNVVGEGPNAESLSWVNGGRGLDFRWDVITPAPPKPAKPVTPYYSLTLRGINLSAAGHDLLVGSRQLMRFPTDTSPTKTTSATPCDSSLSASDGTIVCGSDGFGNVAGEEACAEVPPTLTTYSALTGKQLSVPYRYQGQPCLNGQALVLWTDSDGSHVLTLILVAEPKEKPGVASLFGVVTGGHFVTLPELVIGTGDAEGANDYPGNIAF
jgi:hypothetical protein